MRRLALLAALLVGACGDNIPAHHHDAAPEDAAPDAPPQGLAACLDRPTALPTPPTGALPCELLPPGFTASPRSAP